MEGQRGIEDVRELDPRGGHHIGEVGIEAHHPGGAIRAKVVMVVGKNLCKIGNLRRDRSGVARNQRAVQGENAEVIHSAANESRIARDGAVRHRDST